MTPRNHPWMLHPCSVVLVAMCAEDNYFPRLYGSRFSWNVLILDGDNIVAVCSSPIDIPEMKYGWFSEKITVSDSWSWLDVSSLILRCSEKIRSLLSSPQFRIMKIPVKDVSDCLTKASRIPFFEAIFVSSNPRR
uniref:Acylamino-acid-releasing enzyme N-terminal domain-containing protein n=1 Tax=Vitis vinifera TaxID=29760 RepID=F6I1Q3_VITVI